MKRIFIPLCLALALAGCASANKSTSAGSSMSGMNMGTSTHKSTSGVVSSGSSMPGMTMNSSGGGTATIEQNGVPTPVPIRTIDSGSWNDMKIDAETMTPVPFYTYDGASDNEIKPTKQDSFHLMVNLTDKHTGVAIPYASVWATITNAKGKVVYDERQYPMLSEYMGPHYGDNVALPGPGTYHLSVLVAAPVAAMHVEYAHEWAGRHRVNSTFTWK